MTKAVAEGLPKMRIEEAAAERAAKVDTGETVIVGVNRYRLPRRRSISTSSRSTMPRSAPARSRGWRRCEAARDEAKARAALDLLETGARDDGNLLALSVEAARARCSLGEISDALERAFGRYHTNAGAGQRHLRPPQRRALEGSGRRDARRSPSASAASPASWSPRWARTATTAAPIWSARRSAIWASR